MASIVNRAPFVVSPKSAAQASRAKNLRSQAAADAYKAVLEAEGIPCAVLQAKTGAWEATVRIVGADGKRHAESDTFDTKEQAEAWASAEETKLKGLRKIGATVAAAKTRWEDAVDEWYEKRGKFLSGASVIKYNMPRVKRDIGPDRPIDDVSVAVLRKWRDGLKAEGYAASTVANFRQIVSGTFRYWISERDFPGGNPTRLIQWEKPDNVTQPPTLATKPRDGEEKSEQERLFEAIREKSPWLEPIVEWAMECAMRRGEIAGMMWEDLDFDEMELFIPKTKGDWRKKNTEAKGREIPLWPALVDILDRHFPDKTKRNGKVFAGTLSSMTHSFDLCAKHAGLDHLSFHSLRKIATGRLAKKLPNVVELSKISAHADLATLSRRYYGVELKELADKIAGSEKKEDPLRAIKSSLAARAAKGGKDGKKAAELLALLLSEES